MHKGNSCRLGIISFAFAVGVTFGLGNLILGLLAWKYDWGTAIVQLMATIYKDYAPTLEGALWGGLWGLIEGAIVGFLIAVLYNLCIMCPICKSKD